MTKHASASLSASTCKTCIHREASRLDGYGYCKAAPSLETLGKFLPIDTDCRFGKWIKK